MPTSLAIDDRRLDEAQKAASSAPNLQLEAATRGEGRIFALATLGLSVPGLFRLPLEQGYQLGTIETAQGKLIF